MNKIVAFFRGLFSPGFFKAAIEMNRAIADCRAKHAECRHRFYAVWDPDTNGLVSISYEHVPGRIDSYDYLRSTGKIRPMTREKLMTGCFFYSCTRKSKTNEMPGYLIRPNIEVLRRRYYAK